MIFAGVKELDFAEVFRKARRQIILYAPPFGNFAADPSLCEALESALGRDDGPFLRAFCLPDTGRCSWAREIMELLRPGGDSRSMRRELEDSRRFLRGLKRAFADRVAVLEMPARPSLPVIIVDDRISFGHFAYSPVMTSEGFWCAVEAPMDELFACARCKRVPQGRPGTDRAAFRIVSECAHALENASRLDLHAGG